MPTINNIDSSRGHTCILLRMGEGEDATYFPLFDMAGTENIEKINDFYDKQGPEFTHTRSEQDVDKMKRLVQTLINMTTPPKETEKVTLKEDKSNKDVTSLKQIEPTLAKKINQLTGGKELKLSKGVLDNIKNISGVGTNYIEKIQYEGAYVNHTIAIVIFAMLCLGETQKAEVTADGDLFDEILQTVQEKMKKNKFCSVSEDEPTCDPTKKYLYQKVIDYDQILKSSCIWPHIIFSFLYWNYETKESTNLYFGKTTNFDTLARNIPYLLGFDKEHVIYDNVTLNDIYKVNLDKILKFLHDLADKKIQIMLINNQLAYCNEQQKCYKYENTNFSEITPQYQQPPQLSAKKQIETAIIKKLNSIFRRSEGSKLEQLSSMFDTDVIVIDETSGTYIFKSTLSQTVTIDSYWTLFNHQIIAYYESDDKNINKYIENFDSYQNCKSTIMSNLALLDTSIEKLEKCKNVFKAIPKNVKQTIVMDVYNKIMKEKTGTKKQVADIIPDVKLIPNKDDINFIVKNIQKIEYDKSAYISNIKKFTVLSNKLSPMSDEDNYTAQIERVKDPERDFFPPISILMHCVTGQSDKKPMVDATLNMCQAMYEAVKVIKEP